MTAEPTPAPPDQPYQESTDYAWTESAFELLERDELHAEVVSRDGVTRSRVWGPCPRCRHGLDDRQTHTAVTNLMSTQWRGRSTAATSESGAGGGDADAVFFPVDVSCGCGQAHAGAPPGTTGCGVSFRVEPEVRPGDGGQP
jgi:hypothetical protein